MTFSRILACLGLALFLSLAGCGGQPQVKGQFVLACAAENAFLEPYLRRLAKDRGFELEIRYLTSQDLVQELAKGNQAGADAVLSASGEWIVLGDVASVVKDRTVVLEMPLALGVRQGLAKDLGLSPHGLRADELANLCAQGKLRYVISSPSQSSMGLGIYLGLARAVAGNPQALTPAGLDQAAREKLRAVFSAVARSSGSHIWVKSLFETGDYPAMFNYRYQLALAGQDMAAEGQEPLAVVPVTDAAMSAQAVLGYVDKGLPEKRKLYEAVRDFLISSDMQSQLPGLGRVPAAGQAVRAWDRQALVEMVNLYQDDLRKPSITVYVVELSAKMAGFAEREVKRVLGLAIDPASAAGRFLQSGPRDQSYLVVYNDKVVKNWRLDNLSQEQLRDVLRHFDALPAQGKANPYTALAEAQTILARQPAGQALSSVILIPYDGSVAPGKTLTQVKQLWGGLRLEAPVMCLLFGEFPAVRLDEIAEATRGRIFDGRGDLAKALFAARSCND
jgi:Ca-activated chloride channel family protein